MMFPATGLLLRVITHSLTRSNGSPSYDGLREVTLQSCPEIIKQINVDISNLRETKHRFEKVSDAFCSLLYEKAILC